MSNDKEFNLTKDLYKTIKHQNKNEMTKFMATFYKNAYEDGVKANQENVIQPDELEERISNIKGIGQKLRKAIMEELEG